MKRTGLYTEDTPDIARGIMLLGATEEELAEILDASEANIRAWKTKYPKFAEALKQGGAMAAARVAEALFKRAVGYEYQEECMTKEGPALLTKHQPPDVKACLAWLYNRDPARWKDRQVITDGEGNELLKGLKLVFEAPPPRVIEHMPGHAD